MEEETATMDAWEILETVKPGTELRDFTNAIPYDNPEFYSIERVLPALASLDLWWRRTATGWYKLTVAEYRESYKVCLQNRYRALLAGLLQ